MRSARVLMASVLTAFVAPLVACGNGDDTRVDAPLPPGADAAGADATRADAARDAMTDDAGIEDTTFGIDVDAGTAGDEVAAPPDGALLRVANWSPDAPPVDFCIAQHGTTAFEGPVLARHAPIVSEGGVAGAALGYPGVSAYFLVAPGQYDARLVTGGAPDCSEKIGADATNLPDLLVDGAMTIALVGQNAPPGDSGNAGLELISFADDTTTPTSSVLALRFVNAVPNLLQVDVGKGNGSTFAPLFRGIHFGSPGTMSQALLAAAADASRPTVDANGYLLLTSELDGVTFSARASAAPADAMAPSDLVVSTAVSAATGAVLTIAVLAPGANAEAGASGSEQLLECVDNAGTVDLLGNCSVISP